MRLIDADALKEHKFVGNKFIQIGGRTNGKTLEAVNKAYQQGWNDAIDAIIDNAPTAKLDEGVIQEVLNKRCMTAVANEYLIALHGQRPQGKWVITDAYPHKVYCSVCYKTFADSKWEVWKDGSLPRAYCPNCGAKMGGGAE